MIRISTILYTIAIRLYKKLPFKKQICTILKTLNIKINKFYKDFRFEGVFKIRVESNLIFLMNNYGGNIENETFWKGLFTTFEKEVGWLWKDICKKSNVIFDIGANTGIYSLTAKTVNQSSKIFAFEPSNNTFHKLKYNIVLNKYDIDCFQIALSNCNGKHTLYDSFDTNQTSASMSNKMHKMWENFELNAYEIETQTLDYFVQKNNVTTIDLIKLDVEMFEPEVIEGFSQEILNLKPIIFIEILSAEVGDKLMNLLKNHFAYYHLDEKYSIIKKAKLEPIAYKWNYIICPNEKVNWFENEYKKNIKFEN